jgi:glycosyltransferase involved in cell wall biosynthesis
MIRVVHLRDENEPGGVARMLDFLSRDLGPPFEQTTVLAAPRRLSPLLIEADAVVVHITSIWTKLPYLAALRAARPRGPLVLVEHTYTRAFLTANVEAPERFQVMLRTAYALATHVVAVSEGQAAWLRAQRLVAPGKLSVIRSATDMRALAELPPPRPGRGPLHLGAYGRYAPQKGFDVLVEAMRQVSPQQVRLSIRGLGEGRRALADAARDLPHVSIGGAAHDVGDFLGTLDAVVVPSRWEAFGQVAAEARMAARPLIVTAVDGLPEQCAPACGLVVPPDDPEALALAIQELSLLDPEAMGIAARRSVQRHGAEHLAGWRALLASALPASADQVAATA